MPGPMNACSPRPAAHGLGHSFSMAPAAPRSLIRPRLTERDWCFQRASLSQGHCGAVVMEENSSRKREVVWLKKEVIIDPREIKLLFSFLGDEVALGWGPATCRGHLWGQHQGAPSGPLCQHQAGGESPNHLALVAFFLLMCPCDKQGLAMK